MRTVQFTTHRIAYTLNFTASFLYWEINDYESVFLFVIIAAASLNAI